MALLAVIVLGIGTVLVPRDAGKPPAVPFTESARIDALEKTEWLLESASALGMPGPAGGSPVSTAATVTMLTTQARALLSPDTPATATPSPKRTGPGAGNSSAGSSSAGSPATSQERATPAAFVSALTASAGRRLADAEKADGGMARLLAAVGTAQLLESIRLAAALGLPAPAEPAATQATPDSTSTPNCPSFPPAPTTPAPATPAPTPPQSSRADLAGALSAVVSSEQEAVYAYQVAVTKLDPKASEAASAALGRHQMLLQDAEEQGRLHCVATPPREAGYRLPASFVAKPAAALGTLEADSLTAYAELVALSNGQLRQWAIDAFVETAKRSQAWGAPLDPLPGVPVGANALPSLPPRAAAS
ncbi:ferritin-like domain-containing protein [bacterium RCC_150]